MIPKGRRIKLDMALGAQIAARKEELAAMWPALHDKPSTLTRMVEAIS